MPEHLLEGERLVISLRRHWVLMARSLAIPALVLVLVVFGLDLGLRGRLLPRDAKVIVTLAALAAAGLWAIVGWFRWSATALVLTDQRVLLHEGTFSRSTRVIALDRVQDVSTHQSLLGRLLGYGRVEIDAAGAAGSEVLDHLPQPELFRDQVFVQSERLRRTAATL